MASILADGSPDSAVRIIVKSAALLVVSSAIEPTERNISPSARNRLMSSAIVAVPLKVSVSPS